MRKLMFGEPHFGQNLVLFSLDLNLLSLSTDFLLPSFSFKSLPNSEKSSFCGAVAHNGQSFSGLNSLS